MISIHLNCATNTPWTPQCGSRWMNLWARVAVPFHIFQFQWPSVGLLVGSGCIGELKDCGPQEKSEKKSLGSPSRLACADGSSRWLYSGQNITNALSGWAYPQTSASIAASPSTKNG